MTNPDRLIETYRSYSHAIAADILKRLPPFVDRDDMIGAAELGLVKAAQSFDASRGVLFKTFAFYRIRGAVYDALRKLDWFRTETRMRFEAGAYEYLKDYTEAEAPALNPSEAAAELQQLTSTVVTTFVLSLDSSNCEIPDTNAESADERVARGELRQRVQDALAQLPPTNRKLIQAYYFEEATLEEIGVRLNLSKSWVCRLHAKSLEMLRALLSAAPERAACR